jgi:hypothetical protein
MEFKRPDIAAQFLIAEFTALQERAKNFEKIKALHLTSHSSQLMIDPSSAYPTH